MISLCATGLTTGEIQAHLEDMYGTTVSRDTGRAWNRLVSTSSRLRQAEGRMDRYQSNTESCLSPIAPTSGRTYSHHRGTQGGVPVVCAGPEVLGGSMSFVFGTTTAKRTIVAILMILPVPAAVSI